MSTLVRMSQTTTMASLDTLQSNSSAGRALIDLTGSNSSGYGDKCCPPVVDPYTWLALIGGIALATFFLQMAIVNNIPPGRRKRSLQEEDDDLISKGFSLPYSKRGFA